MSTNEYRLSVRRGPEEGQTFTLTSSSVTVGRDPMAEIVLSDPEVSRQHARFTRTEGGYQLQDLGSTNGTFVDGKRLSGEAVGLQPGAVITMGSNVTVVYEATVDPMATVISPEGFEFDEPDEEEEADDALRTMIEEPDIFAEESEADEPDMDAEEESIPIEFPPAPEPEALPSFDLDEDDDFSFDFDEPDYGEPVAQRGVAPDDRTVLDMEAGDISSFATPSSEDDSLPSFGESSELPSFDDVDDVFEQPPPEAPSGGKMPPPPPPPSSEPDPNRRRNMIIGIVVVLLLCCCCSILVTYFYLGDIILEYLQF